MSGSSLCQTDTTKNKIEFGLCINTIEQSIYAFGRNRTNYVPQLTFSYGNFTSKLGIKYGPNQIQSGYKRELDLKKIRGVIISFQLIPNKKEKIFDLFFVSNISILNFKKYEYSTSPYYSNYYETKSMSLFEPTIGYGFRLKFIKNFYLTTDVSFGYSFQKTTYADESSLKQKELIGNILFGLGYKFSFKKSN